MGNLKEDLRRDCSERSVSSHGAHTYCLLLTKYIDKPKDLLSVAMAGRSLLNPSICSHTINEEPFHPNRSPPIVG